MDGIVVINKEKGYTSRDVVNIVSKKLNIKKIGHAGTLDPLATGVLVLGINAGTKILSFLTSDTKEYIARAIIGIKTDTLDTTGKIINNCDKIITLEDIKKTLKKFTGKIIQEVPKYSAVKIKGKRLYDYARNDLEVVLPKREVEIYELELLDFYEKEHKSYFTLKCLVSKGTYIRSLIDDIGLSLGSFCSMDELKRTKQGNFSIEESILMNDITHKHIKPLENALTAYNKIIVNTEEEKAILDGKLLDKINNFEYNFYYNNKNKLIGIYQQYLKDETKIKPYKIFNNY